MSDFTKINILEDVEDVALKFGMAPNLESRLARKTLGLEKQGVSLFKVAPGFRVPFGHKHEQQEEVYIVVSGSARIKLDDEIVELRQWDAVRVPGHVMRAFEGGPEGAQIIATGAPDTNNADAEMVPGWWQD